MKGINTFILDSSDVVYLLLNCPTHSHTWYVLHSVRVVHNKAAFLQFSCFFTAPQANQPLPKLIPNSKHFQDELLQVLRYKALATLYFRSASEFWGNLVLPAALWSSLYWKIGQLRSPLSHLCMTESLSDLLLSKKSTLRKLIIFAQKTENKISG